MTEPLTYSSYLKIDDLLDLQHPLSDGPEHDEHLFIVIHQVYELWFKQMIHEVKGLGKAFENSEEHRIRHMLKRLRTILKTLVSQVDILETITPISFESFRDRLQTSSGFQSVQFRLLEFKLGKRSESALEIHPKTSNGYAELSKAITEAPLYELFLKYLEKNGYAIPEAAFAHDLKKSTPSTPEIHPILINIYRNDPIRAQVCELMVDIDEGLQEWRYRHIKMVERTIGKKMGTGGSSGASYLQSTLFRPLFPDLWEIRSEL